MGTYTHPTQLCNFECRRVTLKIFQQNGASCGICVIAELYVELIVKSASHFWLDGLSIFSYSQLN